MSSTNHTQSVTIIGEDRAGYQVAESDGFAYRLTKCCGASATGSWDDVANEPIVACRSCYAEVDPIIGAEVTEDDLIGPSSWRNAEVGA